MSNYIFRFRIIDLCTLDRLLCSVISSMDFRTKMVNYSVKFSPGSWYDGVDNICNLALAFYSYSVSGECNMQASVPDFDKCRMCLSKQSLGVQLFLISECLFDNVSVVDVVTLRMGPNAS